MRVYAIGDIHGELEMAQRLMSQILEDLDKNGYEPAELVFLGDYVDRGPDSKGVIEWVLGWLDDPCPFDKVTALKGNHEDFMTEALVNGNTQAASTWIYNGGAQCLLSYSQELDYKAVPKSHIKFLVDLKLYHQIDNYVFVHAGIDPSLEMKDQREQTMLWSRAYNTYNGDYAGGYFVVHGHTPVDKPHICRNQINIDTAAVFGGQLTCVTFDTSKPFLDSYRIISQKEK